MGGFEEQDMLVTSGMGTCLKDIQETVLKETNGTFSKDPVRSGGGGRGPLPSGTGPPASCATRSAIFMT